MGEMDEYDGENGTYISFRCPQPLLFTLQSHSPTSLPNLSLCISFSFSLSYLLEVNTNPSLAVQNHWHHDLLKHMAESLFRVAIDPLFPPPSEAARGELHRRADADGIHESLETSGFGEGDGECHLYISTVGASVRAVHKSVGAFLDTAGEGFAMWRLTSEP